MGLKLKELGPFCPLPPPLHTRSAVSHGCNLDPNLCARTQRLRDKPTSSRSKVHEQSPRAKSREMSGGAWYEKCSLCRGFVLVLPTTKARFQANEIDLKCCVACVADICYRFPSEDRTSEQVV